MRDEIFCTSSFVSDKPRIGGNKFISNKSFNEFTFIRVYQLTGKSDQQLLKHPLVQPNIPRTDNIFNDRRVYEENLPKVLKYFKEQGAKYPNPYFIIHAPLMKWDYDAARQAFNFCMPYRISRTTRKDRRNANRLAGIYNHREVRKFSVRIQGSKVARVGKCRINRARNLDRHGNELYDGVLVSLPLNVNAAEPIYNAIKKGDRVWAMSGCANFEEVTEDTVRCYGQNFRIYDWKSEDTSQNIIDISWNTNSRSWDYKFYQN